MFCGPAKRWFHLFDLKKVLSPLFAPVCHPPGDSDSESGTIAFWLHLPTQRYIGCHGFTKSLQIQMIQTHISSFIHFFLMKTQEWKDCYVHRNIGIRGSNAKYETGMKELTEPHIKCPVPTACINTHQVNPRRQTVVTKRMGSLKLSHTQLGRKKTSTKRKLHKKTEGRA